MLFDNLAVFVMSLVSLLLFSPFAVHNFPLSSSAHRTSADHRRLFSTTENPSDNDLSQLLMDDNDSSLKIFRANLRTFDDDDDEQDGQHYKRSSPTLPVTPSTKNLLDLKKFANSARLSPSLKILLETNPLARAWLSMLLQTLMEEEHVPYIFKYGRRRK